MFLVTAYCPCSRCNGKWTGQPSKSGKPLKVGRTVAVDPKVIKLGSKIKLGDRVYVAEDTGSAIKGNRIDLFMGSHDEALRWGKKLIEVYVKNE